MPFFSIVVPTHNRLALLATALRSVQKQSDGDFECIVVNDAGEVPKLPNDARFKLVDLTQNVGCAQARNVGLEASVGNVVLFLDDDDEYSPARLRSARAASRRGDVLVCSRASVNGGNSTFRPLFGDVRDVVLDGYTPSLGQTAVRRELVETFDPAFPAVEDVEWWLRTAHKADVWSYDQADYLVRSHDGIRHRNGRPERIAGSQMLLEKHRAYFVSHPRASAHRMERLALMSRGEGEHRRSRAWARQAFRALPSARTGALVLACHLPPALTFGQLRI